MRLRSLRRVVRGLVPARKRRFLDFVSMPLEQATPPELVGAPAVGPALVLAPHPDDEVIGCGGTIYLQRRQGARLTVAYMTDGRLGSLRLQGGTLSGGEREAFQRELIHLRQVEAAAAARVLGIEELVFLGLPDGELRLSRDKVERVADLLVATRPEVVYVPFPTDRHRDHVETARIFSAAVGEVTNGCQVYAYEVWSPLYPNCLVDISTVIEVKRQALMQFASQVADTDLVHSVLGLNAYRAAFHLQGRGFAEAFFRCSPREFRKLCRYLVGASS